MELREWAPEKAVGSRLPWAAVKLMPIGDIQYSGAGGPCDLDKLERHLKWGLASGCYFVGMGDYVDFASPSNRRRLKEAGLYDTSADVIDRAAARLTDELLEVLAPTAGRWLGLLEGHHYYEHLDGTTTDTRLAKALRAPFLGTCSMIRLQFIEERHAARCVVWAHHGAGSGVSIGAPLTSLERIAASFDADLYLMGHQHKLVAAPKDMLYMAERSTQLRHRTKMLVGTGSWLKGYLAGSTVGGRAGGTYVERAMLAPVALGGGLITITPEHREGADTIDLKVSL